MAYRGFLLAGIAGVLLCPGAAAAQDGSQPDNSEGASLKPATQDGFQLDVSGGASVESNPFLQAGGGTSAASVYAQLDPTFRKTDEVSSLVIGGTLRVEEYFRRYDPSISGRLGLDVSRRVSPNTTLRAHAAGSTSRTSALDFFTVPGAITPAIPPPILIPDVTFAGTSSRTTQLEAGVGIDQVITEREQISLDLASSVTRFSGSDQADYRYATATTVYRRTLSEQTSGYISLGVGATDYLGRSAGDGIIATPIVGVVTQLGPTISLEAGVGVSFTRVRRADGGHDSRIVPAARAELCQRVSAGTSGLHFSRESQPTALSGVSTVTNVGASVSRRLNEKDQLSGYASYTRTGRPSGAGATQSSADLLATSVTYSRDFNRRFAGFITPSYTRLFDSGISRRANLGLRVGLRYRFGGAG